MDMHTHHNPNELRIFVCSVVKVLDEVVLSAIKSFCPVIAFPEIKETKSAWTSMLVVQEYGRPPTERAA